MSTHLCLVSRQPLRGLLDAPGEIAGGTFGRAVVVTGSPMTAQLKARCGRVGITHVEANDLHRLGERTHGG